MFSYLEKHYKYLVNIPLAIYWIILFILTSMPSSSAITLNVSDKIEHFGAYGLLSVFLYLNLFFQNRFEVIKKFPAAFTIIFASLYGLIDELHQLLVPGRSCEFFDWFADFSGALLGVLIIKWLLKKMYYLSYQKN